VSNSSQRSEGKRRGIKNINHEKPAEGGGGRKTSKLNRAQSFRTRQAHTKKLRGNPDGMPVISLGGHSGEFSVQR